MTPLDRYFADTGDNLPTLARRMGRHASALYRPLKGARNVSLTVALELERATGGKVSALDFLAICLDAKRAHLLDALAGQADQPDAL